METHPTFLMKNTIEGFAWHLPLVFKPCVAKCKFEQGDVIYKYKPSGETWGEVRTDIDFLIQVQYPTRINTSISDDFDVFKSNWNSKIIFEKIYPNDIGLNNTIETTQGQFFTYLWKNDETILDNNNVLLPILNSISTKQINYEFIKSKIPPKWCGFAIILDSVSDLIISKRNSIFDVLSEKFHCYSELFSFTEAISINNVDLKLYSGVSPTIKVELFFIESDKSNEIQEELKNALFKGVKNRFNINIHGMFIIN
jgi:hypothetical protein